MRRVFVPSTLLPAVLLLLASSTFARDLTFEDRVNAQEAVERVYYSHQIGATKPFEEAVPRQVLAAKVRTYLQKSLAVEEYWNTPVTTETLELEVRRMAAHSRLPDRLREILSALGNDRQLILECVARPAVVDRLARHFFAFDRTIHAVRRTSWDEWSARSAPGLEVADAVPVEDLDSDPDAKAGRGITDAVTAEPTCQPDDTWHSSATNTAPEPRIVHTAVWTGTHMIVWGGNGYTEVNSGGRYDPATDTWAPTSTTNAPAGRYYSTAVWTGAQMIVWGGGDDKGYFNSGGRYDPTTDTWSPTSISDAPPGRYNHTAVWTGSRMIVWGGYGYYPNYLSSGGLYDPATDTWSPTSTTNAPAGRWAQTAVWTGTQMIVWGGYENANSSDTYLDSGGRYDPIADTWLATSTTNAPAGRTTHTAVWTGSRMIVWGGFNDGRYFNSGGLYNPIADTWLPTSAADAPSERNNHTAVWTGTEMIVWGGWRGGGAFLSSGGRYVLGASSDGDGDGYFECDGDCDDNDPTVFPGAQEVCDGRDNDCNALVDESLGSTAPETCNGIDDDCDGQIDEGAGATDSDGEGIHDACDSCPFDPLNDADGDGACGDVDECADSDLRPILVIAGCETGVPSALYHTGCTLQDLVNNCGVGVANHGRSATCIAELTNDLKEQDLLTGRQKGQIQRCAT